MTPLHGNAIVAQSGGPTTVINASACGVIQECLRQDAVGDLYGANNGILGIVHEDLFYLRAHSGCIAAATGPARRSLVAAPPLIYVPEIPFSTGRFLDEVREVHARLGRVFVVASEGLVD